MFSMRRTSIPSVSAWSNVVIYVNQQRSTTRTQQRSRVGYSSTVSTDSPVGESLYVVTVSGFP